MVYLKARPEPVKKEPKYVAPAPAVLEDIPKPVAPILQGRSTNLVDKL